MSIAAIVPLVWGLAAFVALALVGRLPVPPRAEPPSSVAFRPAA